MQGDQADMLARQKQVLPLRWFPDDTPVLDTVLNGAAWAWAWVYQLLQYVKAQARISTAEGGWLDLIAEDYFGRNVARRPGETDGEYRRRIQLELIRERGTRQAVISALTDLTARSPTVFEPANTADTGCYGGHTGNSGGFAYCSAGGWGSLGLPLQFFLTAYRPTGAGIGSVSGWGCYAGGYSQGSVEYASLAMVQGQVTDTDIRTAVCNVLPIGVIAWMRISS